MIRDEGLGFRVWLWVEGLGCTVLGCRASGLDLSISLMRSGVGVKNRLRV